jgi:hypothetical protein
MEWRMPGSIPEKAITQAASLSTVNARGNNLTQNLTYPPQIAKQCLRQKTIAIRNQVTRLFLPSECSFRHKACQILLTSRL